VIYTLCAARGAHGKYLLPFSPLHARPESSKLWLLEFDIQRDDAPPTAARPAEE